jgi:O-antigen ligase
MTFLRIGLGVLLAGSVLALGSVEVWAQSPLEIGAAALFVLWAVLNVRKKEARVYWAPLNWPLLGFLAIGLFQLIFHLTPYAFLTRTQLLRLAACFLVFFLMMQAFRTRSELTKLVWFLIIFCFLVSVLAIIQFFTSSREIYWMEALKTGGDSFGPYVNRNHFAGFVELTVPLGLAMMIFRGVHRDQLPLTVLLTIVPISALILSGSRGGIIGFAFELGILALLALSRRAKAWKSRRVIAAAVVALVAVAMVAWVGADRAIAKFSTLKSPEVSLGRRISMARGAAHIFLDHPIIGCGTGALVDVFPAYETAYDGRLVDHVHNDYLETLAETGILGGLCGAAFLILLYGQARKIFAAEQGHLSRAFHAGAIAAVSGILLHSLVDFNLQIPANILLFLTQVSLVIAPAVPSRSPSFRRRTIGTSEVMAGSSQ